MFRNIIKKEGGFTLLELIIVIVIIGILALISIPNITNGPKKERDTQRKTDMLAIQRGLEDYHTANDVYPLTANVSTALTSGKPPILKVFPKDPKAGTTEYGYNYTAASDGSSYVLSDCLENGSDTSQYTVASVTCPSGKSFTLASQN